ncbi:TetR/AcrR family transcriptional regulator [Tetragenococcus halophilus]|uniref:TetR/AcrR family transcriptional regulator n=1 Tax=Tetragenococcus halophilus TaxID=51669 RepID=UPI000CB0B004|nr:TetR/AcrR family transcriptional regulator [Tetragenococcus halophilus]RQD33070.1 TetR/AcrR family transcriptional regulator [Tetragenococcus halophilus subsp. halophilus DSM 20339]GBD60203.1 putative TetR family transcriptional regulator [Tetragenococcus halophilus subsp. halophilus]
MKSKTDLRVIRTRKMILEAFMKLVSEKGYNNVTIQNIAEEAMINRATFYAHFKDKEDLYESIFDQSLNALTPLLDPVQVLQDNKIQLKKIKQILTQLHDVIYDNRDFFAILLSGNSLETFRKKLASITYEKYIDIFACLRITENDVEIPISFIIEFMSSIYISTLHWWIQNDNAMTSEELASLVIKLIGNGHLTVMGIEVEK